MATITSSTSAGSIYGAISSGNNGIGGLMSGMDTDALVEALTLSTRNKIATQNQQKTLLSWKRDTYRSTAESLRNFRSKHFTSTTMKSNAFYNVYKGSSSSSKVKVTADYNSGVGNFKISEIKQLATAATLTSSRHDVTLKGEEVDLYASTQDYIGKTLKITVDDKTTRTIKLDDLQGLDDTSTPKTFEDVLNDLLAEQFGSDVTAVVDSTGKTIELKSGTKKITIDVGCEELGLAANQSNRFNTSSTLATLFPDLTGAGYKGQEVVFSINGVEISANLNESLSTVLTRINNTAAAKVNIKYDNINQNFVIKATDTGAGDTLVLKDVQGNFLNQIFGIQGGSKVVTNDIKATLGYDEELTGKTFDYTDLATVETLIRQSLNTDFVSGQSGKINIEIDGTLYILEISFDDDDLAKLDELIDDVKRSYTEHGRISEWVDYLPTVTPSSTLQTSAEIEEYETKVLQIYLEAFGQKLIESAKEEMEDDFSKVTFFIDNDLQVGFSINDENTQVSITANTTGVNLFNSLGFVANHGTALTNYQDNKGTSFEDLLGTGASGRLAFKVGTGTTQYFNYPADGTTLEELMDWFNTTFSGSASFTVENGIISIDAGDNALIIEDVQGRFAEKVLGISAKTYITGVSTEETITTGLNTSESAGTALNEAALKSFLGSLLDTLPAGGGSIDVTIGSTTYTLDISFTQDELDKLENSIEAIEKQYFPDGVINPSLLSDSQEKAYYAARENVYRNALTSKLNTAKNENQALKDDGHTGKISFSFNSDGEFTITTSDPHTVVSVGTGSTAGSVDLFTGLGFTGPSWTNAPPPDNSTVLTDLVDDPAGGEFTIKYNGVSRTYTFGTTTGGIQINTLNDLFDDLAGWTAFPDGTIKVVNGRLVIDSDAPFEMTDGVPGSFVETAFGESTVKTEMASYETAPKASGAPSVDSGQNAIITVTDEDGSNPTILESSTNSFDVNGVKIEVYNTHDPLTEDPIEITVVNDGDDLVEKLQNWVEEYNTMVETLNKMIYEKKVDGYDPLTDEQKADMSEDEIKKWEKEAQKGLMFSDAAIRTVLSKLRTCIYETVETAGLAPYDIGLTTTSLTTTKSGTGYDYTLSGTLELNETRLRAALEANPDAVRVLFNDKDEGLITRLDAVLDSAVNTSSDLSVRGSLVYLAGTDLNTADNTSVLGDKIDRIDKQIATLKARLEKEYKRYWRQFTALETALSKLNAQAGWLNDFAAS